MGLSCSIDCPYYSNINNEVNTMIEWIQDNWMSVVGTVAVIGGGMYIPVVRGFVLMGLKTMISEAVLKKIAIQMVEKLVKSTKNKLDDIWFAEFKKKVEDA
tara:strand:- start:498 stop:800 length:303 start_codon:yes stop_codon:yes gene_type:complete